MSCLKPGWPASQPANQHNTEARILELLVFPGPFPFFATDRIPKPKPIGTIVPACLACTFRPVFSNPECSCRQRRSY